MKKSIILLVLVVVLGGCGSEAKVKEYKKTYPTIELKIETYIIDSCEYIGSLRNSNNDLLVHKGNCKYCIERNRK